MSASTTRACRSRETDRVPLDQPETETVGPIYRLTEKQLEMRSRLRGEKIGAETVRYFLAYGGSRSGKTFFILLELLIRALLAPGSRHLVLRRDAVACKSMIGGDTLPKVYRMHCPELAEEWSYGEHYNKTEGRFILPNKSEIVLAGLNDRNIDRILGSEYASIYICEASEIGYASFETVLSRLAQVVQRRVDHREIGRLFQRVFVDLNPTTSAHWTYRLWVDGVEPETERPLPRPEQYAYVVANPVDNAENLDPAYIESLDNLSPALRRRFRDGSYQADAPDALFKRGWIRRKMQDYPEMRRIVVALDPAATARAGSSETGIVVAGIDINRMCYVLADLSDRLRPEEWARRAVAAYREWEADCIVGEVNNGGDMIEAAVRAAEVADGVEHHLRARYKEVRATRGKVIRAEPITGLYEQGRVYHCGEFVRLEDQMCSVTLDFDAKQEGWSPDRMDALVWALTELHGPMTKRASRVSTRPEPRGRAADGWMGA